MSWIRQISDDEAGGPLKNIYDAANKRAGRVFNILRVQSLNPAALQKSLEMYQAIMFGPSGLSRGIREFIAVVVSRANHCHY
jgi:uncharacterized peroxidase-related enzyme